MNNIFLIGFMGAGKSTVGWELAHLLHRTMIDSDRYLVKKAKRSIASIFEEKGEAYFRDLEAACMRELANQENRVISCGGGVAMRQENVDTMRKGGKIVLIEAKPETILERVSRNNNRPLLEGRKNIAFIRQMMDERLPYYEKAADVTVCSDEGSAREVAIEIAKKLGFSVDVEKKGPHDANDEGDKG